MSLKIHPGNISHHYLDLHIRSILFRELKIVQAREHLFRESVARVNFWRTDRVDKTKLKTIFSYQHTLLNIPNDGGLNCASEGI